MSSMLDQKSISDNTNVLCLQEHFQKSHLHILKGTGQVVSCYSDPHLQVTKNHLECKISVRQI